MFANGPELAIKMGTKVNDDSTHATYRKCEQAFAASMADTLLAVLRSQLDLSIAQREKLLPELLFAVAAHISGSSYGGEVDGDEVYPVVGTR